MRAQSGPGILSVGRLAPGAIAAVAEEWGAMGSGKQITNGKMDVHAGASCLGFACHARNSFPVPGAHSLNLEGFCEPL